MAEYFGTKSGEVAAMRARLSKVVEVIDAGAVAPASPCQPPKLTLNMFPSNAFPGTGTVEVLAVDDLRAALAGKRESVSWLSTVAGRGEQALLVVLAWAERPLSKKAAERSRKAIDASLALPYLIVLRDASSPEAMQVDLFLVETATAKVLCERSFSAKSDGKGTEAYNLVEAGTGRVVNGYRINPSDRMAAAMSAQMAQVLRGEFHLDW